MPECPDCGEDVPTMRTTDGHARFVQHGECNGWFRRVDWDGDPKSEGRFTEPRDDCPNPERWHSDDADSTEHEISMLVGSFVRALQPDLVVETGSAWGRTAEFIGDALFSSGHGVLHTIEPDPARADATRKRCEGLPVVVEQMESLRFVPPSPVGFAWLDSLPALRVPEFRRFYEHLIPGAIVGIHDTGIHKGGMREAIEVLETEGLFLPIHLNTPRGVTFGEVLKP